MLTGDTTAAGLDVPPRGSLPLLPRGLDLVAWPEPVLPAPADRRSTAPPRRVLLRWGASPLLVLADVAAGASAAAAGPGTTVASGLLLVATLVLMATAGLYRSRLSLSVLDDLPPLVARSAAAAAVTTSALVVLRPDAVDAGLARGVGVLIVVLVLARTLAYALVRGVRSRGWVSHPTLILGAGEVGGQLAASLLAHRSYGLRPVGFLDVDPLLAPDRLPVPLLGGTDRLAETIAELGVQDVVVAFGALPESQVVDVLRTCDRLAVEIFVVPRLFEVHGTARDMDQVWGVPMVRVRRSAFRSPRWRIKRLLDVVLAGTALVVLLPLLLALALAVRTGVGRPVLFRQERVGLGGRSFHVLKFRSLVHADEEDSATTWSVAGDERVPAVGRLLRATSLDELPQLWNVVRGDMSLVGPRPERPHFVADFSERHRRYSDRHRVPVGVTGWAQVHGLRGDTSIADRARFDNYYIENWSVWGDMKILLRTAAAVLRRTGS